VLHFADIAYFVGFAVAAIVYWLLSTFMRRPVTEPSTA
jgi:cytosine/uracil/thiamine/allantoin permease